MSERPPEDERAVSTRARARELRERALANPAFAERVWKPGQSGNPRGAIGEWQRCRALCREHSEAAAQEIIRLFSESEDDRVRYMAAQWTYEQAWGKPREYDPNAEREPMRFDASKLTPEQRQQVREALRLLAGTVAPVADKSSA
jgi:hypothetical protein